MQHPESRALAWQQQAVLEIGERLADDTFPCLFARKAWRDGSIHYHFCDGDPFAAARDGLLRYTAFVRSVAMAERLYCPLALVFRCRPETAPGQQHSLAWRILGWLHRHDPAPWPADVPGDPEDPSWTFCFDGVQLFVNISSAAHIQLRSRNLGHCLVLVVNPRENFDAVSGASSLQGRNVRARIRARMTAYNEADVAASLGFHGEPGNREWTQYQLAEPGLPAPEACPLAAVKGHRPA